MNREDIIRMAREAGLAPPDGPFITWGASDNQLERFAALVAAAEREACAKLLNENANFCSVSLRLILESNAEAIRSRGQQ